MKLFKWRIGRDRKRGNDGRGFLGRLRRDERGATLAMMAAVTIPMIGMVGGAVDASRAYLVKTRLQQACDAGVLAARRVMAASTLAQSDKDEGTRFFNINLAPGTYGSFSPSFVVTDVLDAGSPTGQVHGAASVHVPTTLMKVFGNDEIVLNATCEAQLNISNNDIMFVLDVTGSMNCAASDTTATCSNNGGVEKTNARIKALRTAVVDFYDTMAGATSGDARLRFGFVPYSTTVNLGTTAMTGGILPTTYVVDSWPYQSRRRIVASYGAMTTVNGAWSVYSSSQGAWSQHSSQANRTQTQCDNTTIPGNTTITYGTTTQVSSTTSTDANDVRTTSTVQQRTGTYTTYRRVWGVTDTSPPTKDCVIQKATVTQVERRTNTGTEQPDYTWRYEQITMNTSQYKLGSAVTTRTANGFANQTSSWTGCIEERDTVANTSFSPIPDAAYDLDIDEIPSNTATKWRPAWQQIIWGRPSLAASDTDSDGSTTAYTTYLHPAGDMMACPKRAAKLAVMTRQQVYDYVNASDFLASGYTYHDTGLIWGARLISAQGIFSAENATASNGKPVNRHIIFMTDGDMNPTEYAYSLYGFERLDRRVGGGSTTDLEDRHNARFSAMCDAIKAKNITLWVVAYAQSMTTTLQNCADSGKAFYASNDAQLRAQFNTIAQQIAELRLSE